MQDHGGDRKMQQGRLSRRRLIGQAGLAGAGALAAGVACKTSSGSTSTKPGAASTAKQPKKGGILNYAGGIVGSFDTQGSGFDSQTVAASTGRNYAFFYERLVAYN